MVDLVLHHQRIRHRVVAQRRTVVAQPLAIATVAIGVDAVAARHRLVEGRPRARLVAHELQGDAQVHQRQRRPRPVLVVVVEHPQRGKRRLLLPGQDIGRVGQFGEAAMAVAQQVVVAVAQPLARAGGKPSQQVLRQAGEIGRRLLQLGEQPVRGAARHQVGHIETRRARVLQEARHIGRQPDLLGAVTPQREAAASLLHAGDAADRTFDHALSLGPRARRQPQARASSSPTNTCG